MFEGRLTVIVADYSAKRLTGAQLQSAGFVGAIRYAGLSESNIKITNAAEVTSIKAAGLAVALVYELGLTDTSGGYNAGRANATALRNHALALGLPARGFLAQDQHIPAGQSTNVLAYFQGAASVLGAANTGVYGSMTPWTLRAIWGLEHIGNVGRTATYARGPACTSATMARTARAVSLATLTTS